MVMGNLQGSASFAISIYGYIKICKYIVRFPAHVQADTLRRLQIRTADRQGTNAPCSPYATGSADMERVARRIIAQTIPRFIAQGPPARLSLRHQSTGKPNFKQHLKSHFLSPNALTCIQPRHQRTPFLPCAGNLLLSAPCSSADISLRLWPASSGRPWP